MPDQVTAEAAPIIPLAAAVYQKHTRPWLIGVIVHGSAVKGGFVQGCSDIDFQLYLESSAFSERGKLPLELCMDIQRDLAKIDPAPFRYIQCNVLEASRMKSHIGPVPGTYRIISGRLPVAEATREQLVRASRASLENVQPVPDFIRDALVEHGGGRLSGNVRLLCTKIWPIVYSIPILQGYDPVEIWNLPKEGVIERIPADIPLGVSLRNFYSAVKLYYPEESSLESALDLIKYGTGFLSIAKNSWDNNQQFFQGPGQT